MSLTPDEIAVQSFLQPLRTLPPVTRRPAPERHRGRWFHAVEFGGVAIAVVLLVGLIALLAHRHAPSQKPIAPPVHHRPGAQLTYLSDGDIAQGPWVHGRPQRWVLRGQHIRAFGWSPDGRRLAYLSSGLTSSGSCSLEIVKLESPSAGSASSSGSGIAGTVPCTRSDQVMWSPDGRRVAYTSDRRLFVVTPATNKLRWVATTEDGGFTWWPGGRLAFSCPLAAGVGQWCSILPDGTHITKLAVRGLDILWSPASGRVAYVRVVRGVGAQVWTATADGRHARRWANWPNGPGVAPFLAWAPDGRRLVASGTTALVIDTLTGRVTLLPWWATQGFQHRSPSWHPAWRR